MEKEKSSKIGRKTGGRTRRVMFQVKVTDFRCFADAPAIEVRPITFLVGENSAGKTSFLAATRILLEAFNYGMGTLNPFNAEPYYLGSFDQIAHYRGGPRGRAKKFVFEIVVPPRARPPSSTTTRHKFTFVKGSPQPELAEYEFSVPETSVVLTLAGAAIVTIRDKEREILQHKFEQVPFAAIRRDLKYLQYVLQDLNYSGDVRKRIGDRPELKQLVERLFREFRSSGQMLTRSVFASAPVRTQPRRIYIPSEITASAEGEHVPLEMARQRITSPDEWATVRDKLARFGKDSGLFEDIDIKLLGRKDGDPFQLTVRTGGPPMNIVDVGYGVSQALPIIYLLEQSTQYDTFLLQQPEVHLHPRAQAELGTLIARISKQRPGAIHIVETHSDYIIDRVRMEIAEKQLDPRTVTIVFFDREEHKVKPRNIFISEQGEIVNPPAHFRAFFLREQQRLLGL